MLYLVNMRLPIFNYRKVLVNASVIRLKTKISSWLLKEVAADGVVFPIAVNIRFLDWMKDK